MCHPNNIANIRKLSIIHLHCSHSEFENWKYINFALLSFCRHSASASFHHFGSFVRSPENSKTFIHTTHIIHSCIHSLYIHTQTPKHPNMHTEKKREHKIAFSPNWNYVCSVHRAAMQPYIQYIIEHGLAFH